MGWSYNQLMATPAAVLSIVDEMMVEEADRIKQRQS